MGNKQIRGSGGTAPECLPVDTGLWYESTLRYKPKTYNMLVGWLWDDIVEAAFIKSFQCPFCTIYEQTYTRWNIFGRCNSYVICKFINQKTLKNVLVTSVRNTLYSQKPVTTFCASTMHFELSNMFKVFRTWPSWAFLLYLAGSLIGQRDVLHQAINERRSEVYIYSITVQGWE